jgi:hypothetical protein
MGKRARLLQSQSSAVSEVFQDVRNVVRLVINTVKTAFPTSGDANALVINDVSGDVGLGTDTPGEKLHVAGNVRIDTNILESANGNLTITADTPPDAVIDTILDNRETLGANATAHRLAFQINGSSIAQLATTRETADNVGFLVIQSNAGAGLAEIVAFGIGTSNSTFFNRGNATMNFTFRSSVDTNSLHVNGTSGNVGVGTGAPGEKLDVNGRVGTDAVVFNPTVLAGIPNNGLFVDSADNSLKFKGALGTVTVLAPP